jgi:hypothetical protein
LMFCKRDAEAEAEAIPMANRRCSNQLIARRGLLVALPAALLTRPPSGTTSSRLAARATTSVRRRRLALDFDIELQEPVEQRGLPTEVASAISVARGCVMSVFKEAEPEQRSEDSCLHRH